MAHCFTVRMVLMAWEVLTSTWPSRNKGNWVERFNIGKPMNSNADDFGIVFTDDMASGYMSSNRKGGTRK